MSQEGCIEDVASGQKLVIRSILLQILTTGFATTMTQPTGTKDLWTPSFLIVAALALTAFAMALLGVMQLAAGLGKSILTRIFLIVLASIPFLSLAVLLILNLRATRRLRDAGYKVGLLGASK